MVMEVGQMKVNKKMVSSLFSLVLGTFVFVSAVHAAAIRTIDLESATIEADWDLVDSGVTITEKKLEHNNVTKPFLSTYTPSGTGFSLKFQHNPYTGTKQRTEYYLAPYETFSSWKYMGYQLAVPTSSALPEDWTVINQFQQHGFYVSPIGAMELNNVGGNMNMSFEIRNEDYYYIDGSNGPSGNALQLWNSNISGWNSVVIGFKPGPAGAGQVKIWFNGTLVTDWTGKLGFTPGFLGKAFTNYYQTTFGIYRGGQNNTMITYFDNVKWGTTYADVAP
jgi:hypothetical protein